MNCDCGECEECYRRLCQVLAAKLDIAVRGPSRRARDVAHVWGNKEITPRLFHCLDASDEHPASHDWRCDELTNLIKRRDEDHHGTQRGGVPA